MNFKVCKRGAQPTQHLWLSSGGSSSSPSPPPSSLILSSISSFLPSPAPLSALASEHHSIISFKTVEDAVAARDALNGLKAPKEAENKEGSTAEGGRHLPLCLLSQHKPLRVKFCREIERQPAVKVEKPAVVPFSPEEVCPSLEDTHVHQFYNTIAPHFSMTRHKPWPQVKSFLQSLPAGVAVLDAGCGNGRYFGCLPQSSLHLACDRSEELLKLCKDRGHVVLCDALSLPFKRQVFDVAICIAVLHHISTLDRRKRLVDEVLACLVPGGKALFTAWAIEQDDTTSKRDFESQDVMVPWKLPKEFLKEEEGKREAEEGKEQPASSSSSSSSSSPFIVVPRFCHMFKEGEIEELVLSCSSPVEILSSYYDQSNWCTIVKKT